MDKMKERVRFFSDFPMTIMSQTVKRYNLETPNEIDDWQLPPARK